MRFNWMKIKLIFLLVLISGLFYSTVSVNNLRDIIKTDIYIDNSNNNSNNNNGNTSPWDEEKPKSPWD